VAGAGQLEWLLQGKEKSILDDSEAAIDDDNNGLYKHQPLTALSFSGVGDFSLNVGTERQYELCFQLLKHTQPAYVHTTQSTHIQVFITV